MRIGNLAGRAVLVDGDHALDIHTASQGRFGPDTRSVLRDWEEFTAWGAGVDASAGERFDPARLLAPVTDPLQLFAIGLNYRAHADESQLAHPEELVVFTKFASSLTGPIATVSLPGDTVDWEVELVVVIGRTTHRVSETEARQAIAGYTIGQDISERTVQMQGPAPQFSLGKSFPGFAPLGPVIVTADELPDPDDLSLTSTLEGPTARDHGGTWLVQEGRTSDMIFPVARIISDLSQVVTLHPGDLIFTGTPPGVGMGRGIYLQPGDTIVSAIEGLGTMRTEFV